MTRAEYRAESHFARKARYDYQRDLHAAEYADSPGWAMRRIPEPQPSRLPRPKPGRDMIAEFARRRASLVTRLEHRRKIAAELAALENDPHPYVQAMRELVKQGWVRG